VEQQATRPRRNAWTISVKGRTDQVPTVLVAFQFLKILRTHSFKTLAGDSSHTTA
jgi:hypothetical protein